MGVSQSWGEAEPEVVPLLNVSYDPTRELYQRYNRLFIDHYQASTGIKVVVSQSHGGSGKQARSVIEGLRADVVTLALAYDIQIIVDHHLIGPDWETRLPHDASPYTSTIVFLVRAGNPKNIKDWDDLIRPGIQVITPNPKTSGGARWNFLAAWGFQTIGHGTSDSDATDFVTRLYRNVPILDSGARGATTTFVQKKIGDVYLTWENEAELALKEHAKAGLQVIYPSISILAQPCVAWVDRNLNRRGPMARRAAEEYLRFLYSDAAQELVAQSGYRPSNRAILARFQDRYPNLRLFTIKEMAGTWKEAQKRFFGEDGVFDRMYRR